MTAGLVRGAPKNASIVKQLLALISVTACLGLVAGCGESTVKQGGAEDTVTEFVQKETGFKATDVKCPSGVEAKVGKTFDCNFTGPEGPYVAHMKITNVDGEKVLFQIQTERL